MAIFFGMDGCNRHTMSSGRQTTQVSSKVFRTLMMTVETCVRSQWAFNDWSHMDSMGLQLKQSTKIVIREFRTTATAVAAVHLKKPDTGNISMLRTRMESLKQAAPIAQGNWPAKTAFERLLASFSHFECLCTH